ncbi:MAG: tetratricopeptide repeat protein, partial [Acidimicrobiales bacterium]|nr:tetratricopeptide repeat protein [Acidimicrobiales bacterium]
MFRELGDLHSYLIASRFATVVAILDGRLDEARQTAEEALALARRMGNDHEAAEAQRFLGRIALETGDTGEARGHYDRAIPGLLRCGDLRCSGRAHAENALA